MFKIIASIRKLSTDPFSNSAVTRKLSESSFLNKTLKWLLKWLTFYIANGSLTRFSRTTVETKGQKWVDYSSKKLENTFEFENLEIRKADS